MRRVVSVDRAAARTSRAEANPPCGRSNARHKLEHLFKFSGGVALATWFLLAMAIVAEVTATTSLKLSDGFTKILPVAVVVVGYLASFFLLARILERGMSLGVVYAIWSAIGVALIVLVDAVWFGHQLTAVQLGGMVLVVAGVIALELGGATA
jgi:small multidrug resistance pump